MKFSKIVAALTIALSATAAQAEVISFTPVGGSATVQQYQDLYFHILTDGTSTSNFGWTGNFSLSGHGDFHFWNANMVKNNSWDGGANLAAGTLIGAGSNFGDNYGYAGTDGFNGDCARGMTCLYGLQFNLEGDTHFGWVKFSEGTSTQSLLGWGYESVAGRSIAAGATAAEVPEPLSTALFGAGLLGMAALRRRKQSK